MRRREGPLGEDVGCGLVLADVQEIRVGADLVQGSAQEQLVPGDAGQIERTGRHEEDLIARRREVVLLVAAVLEVGDDRLARLLERDDGVANFLNLAP